MAYKPPFVVLDYETEEDGRGSTEFYRPNFRVSSAAFSWIGEHGGIESKYITTEHAVGDYLHSLVQASIPLVVHNCQFEIGVTKMRFPETFPSCIWHADTMRLVQVFDNGGDPMAFEYVITDDDQLDAIDHDESEKPTGKKLVFLSGLGLVKSVRRILRLPNHKLEAHEWLHKNVPECKKGKEGKFLNLLPADMLERYNVGDTEACLKLYQYCTGYFDSIGYKWQFDHQLYMASVHRIVETKIRGVPVDRVALQTYKETVEREIEDIGTAFRSRFLQPILAVERHGLLEQIRRRKTLRGRKRYLRRIRQLSECDASPVRFNVGSNKQLTALFVRELRMSPKFLTDKNNPSFRSAVLGQWGEGGEMLKTRRKRMLVLKQTDALLELSSYDGRFHIDLKACGTSTGRFAGGAH